MLKKVKKVLKSLILGDRGLEIHRYGAGSTLFVAIYRRLLIGHWRHHFESTFLVWHAWAHWWKVVGNPQILRPNWHFDMMEDDTIQCMFLAWGAWNTLYWLTDVAHCLKITQNVSLNFWLWHFPPFFILLKLIYLVTLFDNLQVYTNTLRSQFWMILFLWFSNIVKVFLGYLYLFRYF